MIDPDLRDRILAEPEVLLEDRDVMNALTRIVAYKPKPKTKKSFSRLESVGMQNKINRAHYARKLSRPLPSFNSLRAPS